MIFALQKTERNDGPTQNVGVRYHFSHGINFTIISAKVQYFRENRRRYSLQRNLRRRNYRKRDPGAGAVLLLIPGMLLAQSEPERQQVRIIFRGRGAIPRCAANTTGHEGESKIGFSNFRRKRGDTVSVKVKVSYQDRRELEKIVKLLRPVIKSYKVVRGQQGAFKRAYIEIAV